jgi:hypothetical protein
VDRLGLEVEEIIRVPAGSYVTPFAKVTRTIILEEGELYYFRIYDVMEDGLGSGYGECIILSTNFFLNSWLVPNFSPLDIIHCSPNISGNNRFSR